MSCALCYSPDELSDYLSYEDYFYSRKKWFFSVLGLTFAAGFIDTLIKGKEYMASLHWEYPVSNIVHILLCLIAIKVNNKRFHSILVIVLLAYEISFIIRKYYS